ncbi:MAG: MATE family efflux transporter [Blautia sp.]
MTVNGLIQGCLPIMRFNYGAGNRDRLHSASRYETALVSGMMILGTFTVILFPAQLLGLFTASESMRSFGISAMRIMAVSYLFCGWSTMISTYLKANRTGLSKYTDPATASSSAAHFIHVAYGKTPEDYRDLAVLPCHRNGNIRSGASDLPSRQKNRNALQPYKAQ